MIVAVDPATLRSRDRFIHKACRVEQARIYRALQYTPVYSYSENIVSGEASYPVYSTQHANIISLGHRQGQSSQITNQGKVGLVCRRKTAKILTVLCASFVFVAQTPEQQLHTMRLFIF